MSKPERNDPCPCGSGKKFKKCCEFKKKSKKIHAQIITPGGGGRLSSFFQKKVVVPRQEAEKSLQDLKEKVNKEAAQPEEIKKEPQEPKNNIM